MATIDIRTIKVLLDTNIPGKEIVPLTKAVLYQPKLNTSGWNDMPFFTMDAEYPESYLSSFTYDQQMEFFFNKQKMTELIRMKSKIIQKTDDIQLKTQTQIRNETTQENKSKKIEEKQSIEKDTEIKKIDEKQQQEIEKIKQATRTLECSIISKIEGIKSVAYTTQGYYNGNDPITIKISDQDVRTIQTFDEYEKAVRDRHAVITTPWKTSLSDFLEKKHLFELTEKGKKIEAENKKPVCEADLHKDTVLFKNLPKSQTAIETQFWKSYKKEFLNMIQEIENNPVYSHQLPKDKMNEWKQALDQISFSYNYELFDEKGTVIEQTTYTETNLYPIQNQMCILLDKIKQFISTYKETFDKIKEAIETPIKVLNDNKEPYIHQKQNEETHIDEIKEKYNKEKLALEKNPTIATKNPTQVIMSTSEYELNRNKIGEKNIMIMIRLMFPTKYPLVGNIFSSFHSVVTGKNEFHLKWTDFLPKFFKKQLFEGIKDYSYLKLDGSVYTVTQAIWLNDIYNHKEYKSLIDKFEELKRWKDKEIMRSNNELLKGYTAFQQTFRSGLYEINSNDSKNVDNTYNVNFDKTNPILSEKVAKYQTAVKSLSKVTTYLVEAINADNLDKNKLLDNASKFVELMTLLHDNTDYNSWFQSKLENREKYERIRSKMKQDLDSIKAQRYILETYLQRPGINMDYEKDVKHKSMIEEKYSTYTRFVDNIRKFRAPVLESSNLALQNTIEDFLNNTEKVKNVFIFLMNPVNVKKNPFSDLLKMARTDIDVLREEAAHYQDRLNTGITIRPSAQEGQPYYEVYIQVNVIGGEVNDENKSAVDCMYQGESLGDKLARLLNEALYLPWTMNNSRIFFDITQGEAKSHIEKQEKEKKEKEEKAKSPSEKKGGRTRKFRERLIQTRRLYRLS